MTIAEQIVNLKIKNSLLEKDFEKTKSIEWYEYALSKSLVELLFDKDELVGFLVVVRIDYIPRNLSELELNYDIITTGKVAFVAEVCAKDLRSILYLRKRAFYKHIGVTYIMWHNKKSDRMIIRKHIRGKHASLAF